MTLRAQLTLAIGIAMLIWSKVLVYGSVDMEAGNPAVVKSMEPRQKIMV